METDSVSAPTSHLLDLEFSDLPIETFLSRPILIDKFAIPFETDIWKKYDLYNILLRNELIRKKLRNYGFMKADLKIKIVTSGTQFHQGRLQAAWVPWGNQTNNTKQSLDINNFPIRRRALSTMPLVRYADIRQNKPIEFNVPYISPQPMSRLFNPATTVS